MFVSCYISQIFKNPTFSDIERAIFKVSTIWGSVQVLVMQLIDWHVSDCIGPMPASFV